MLEGYRVFPQRYDSSGVDHSLPNSAGLRMCVELGFHSNIRFKGVPRDKYLMYEVCPENSRIYRVKIFQSYLEAIQPCRLQSPPLYSERTAASVSTMF